VPAVSRSCTRSRVVPIRLKIDLVVYGILLAGSFAGFLAFCLDPQSVRRFPFDPDALPLLQSGFAQVQIVLATLLLGHRLGAIQLRILSVPLFSVSLASLCVEALGVRTGIPFGAYEYSPLLGHFLPGGVPWTVPLSWTTASLSAYLFVSLRLCDPGSGLRRVLATSLLLLAWDLSLDPAMSRLNDFWSWKTEGAWFGVPLSNLAGWYLSGLAFAAILEGSAVWKRVLREDGNWLKVFLVLFAALPVAMDVAGGMWVAALATAAAAVLALALSRRSPSKSRPSRPEPETTIPSDAKERLAHMSRNSRSFRFASAFLSAELQELVSGVYSWCRFTDDLVDGSPQLASDVLLVRLEAWEDISRMAYDGVPTGIPLVDETFGKMAGTGTPFEYAHEVLEGMRMDLEPGIFRSGQDLRLYSYRVASVIGVWLSRMAGVSDPWVLERAEALGHAMQLTNILRDVGEDLAMDRIYIPLDDLESAGLDREALRAYADGSRPLDGNWADLMERLMDRADRDYALAFEGMPYLPWSFRLAVAVAGSVYQGIHDRIRTNGYDNFRHRAATGSVAKCRLAAQGLVRLLRTRKETTPAIPGLVSIPK
jgi:15-cis-phytoene synthase